MVREPGEVLAVPTGAVRERALADPALGNLILRAYLQRTPLRVAIDRHGFVLTCADAARAGNALSDVDGSPAVLETGRTGVFAVGDVRSGSIKRIAAAVGEGSMAVRLVHAFLAMT